MKSIEFTLFKQDGTSRRCKWAPWFSDHVYYGPLYNDDLTVNILSVNIKADRIIAYAVTERDNTWDPDSAKYMRRFPWIFYDKADASYIIRPGDTVIHNEFAITLKADMYSYFALDENLRTLYELQ